MTEQEYQFTSGSLLTTRRTAIENLVLFPATLLAAVQWSSRTDFVAKEFLIQCAPCIMACSYLLKGGGFATVEQMLPPYLRQLTKMANSPSPLQKEAAYLAAQGHCLMSTIKLHRRQFDGQVACCKKAVEFAKVTGNKLFVAATLTRLGNVWFFSNRAEKTLEAFQEAERLLKEEPALFPARLQSRIYTGLSNAHAHLGHTQDADYYLGTANAISLSLDDDLFIPALDYDLANKISIEGLICRRLGELVEDKCLAGEAVSWYKKAEAALAQKLPPGSSERLVIQAEIINRQGSIAEKLGNKEIFVVYVTKGALRSKASKSKQREHEAKSNVRAGKQRWKHERDVEKLDELFDSDENVQDDG